jgi:hypothetical protein
MCDGREELLKRVTLAGWLLIVVDGAAMAFLVPLALARGFPEAFAAIASSGRLFALIATTCGLVVFFAGKCLLEMLGVPVVRPKDVKQQS